MSRTILAKVQHVGNSLGLELLQEALQHLSVKEGDELAIVSVPDGFILLRADSKLLRTMKHAADCMNRYPNTLRDLGK